MKRLPSRFSLLLLGAVLVIIMLTLLGSTFQAVAGAAPLSLPGAARFAQRTATPEPSVAPTPSAEPEAVPGDTTGILIMAAILVVIILFGTFWGRRVTRGRLSR